MYKCFSKYCWKFCHSCDGICIALCERHERLADPKVAEVQQVAEHENFRHLYIPIKYAHDKPPQTQLKQDQVCVEHFYNDLNPPESLVTYNFDKVDTLEEHYVEKKVREGNWYG